MNVSSIFYIVEVSEKGEVTTPVLLKHGINYMPLMLRVKDVSKILNMGVSTVWEKVNPEHPKFLPDFPKPKRLEGATYWNLLEILDYVKSLSEKPSFFVAPAANDSGEEGVEASEQQPAPVFNIINPVIRTFKNESLPLLMGVDKVAELFDCSPSTVWNRINEKHNDYIADFPKPTKIHGRTQWVTEDVISFVLRVQAGKINNQKIKVSKRFGEE